MSEEKLKILDVTAQQSEEVKKDLGLLALPKKALIEIAYLIDPNSLRQLHLVNKQLRDLTRPRISRLKYEEKVKAQLSKFDSYQTRTGLLAFPDELLLEIANLLNSSDVQQFSLVCKQFRKLIVEKYTCQGKTFITLTIQLNFEKKEAQRKTQKKFLLSKFKNLTEDAYLTGIHSIEKHKQHIDQSVMLEIESTNEEIRDGVVRNKKIYTKKYLNLLAGVNIILMLAVQSEGLFLTIGANYYPKDKFQPSFCEDNFTYQNITVCQDTADKFLYATSFIWYLDGITAGLGVQILDNYLYKYLVEKKFKQLLPTFNNVPTTKDKIVRVLWSVYDNRNHILLIPCLALFITQLQLHYPSAKECIVFEENDYFQINQECLDARVNKRAEEFFYLSATDGFLIGFAFVSILSLLFTVPCKVAKWVKNTYDDYGFFGNSTEGEHIPLTSTPALSNYSGGGAG